MIAISLSAWRGISVFLLLVIFLQFYLSISHGRSAPYQPTGKLAQIIFAPKRPSAGQWQFDHERDGNNPGLTAEQCDAAFPELYYEIDRSVDVFKNKLKHKITPEDVDISWRNDAAMKVMIYDNQIRVIEEKNTWGGGYYKRAQPVLSQLHRALLGASAAGEKLPNIEFPVVVDDMSMIPSGENDTQAIWTFTRNNDASREWIIPEFGYWANPPASTSFYDMQLRAEAEDKPFAEKIPKAVWRGVKWTAEKLRGNLLDKSEGQPWSDIKEMSWADKADFMRMEDMCGYAFVVHTEGRSWSGRLKYILNCNSIIIVHKLNWQAHLYHLLIPDGPSQNYVQVERDFSDMEEKVEYLLAHPDQAQKIVDNAMELFRSRYTTVAAESCYWRRLVKSWSEVAFEPEPWHTVKIEVGGKEWEERQVRGKTYEELVVMSEKDVETWKKEQKERRKKEKEEKERRKKEKEEKESRQEG